MSDGSVRFGAYRLLERLGEGGMCMVFRARKDAEERDCALKVLKDAARKDPKTRDAFATEADVSLLLEHPNLIRTYEAGDVDGRSFIAMELVEGTTLADLVTTLRARGLEFPPDLALFVVTEVLEGLHALHEVVSETGEPLGLVHRDVTPDNIFLGFDGRVLLGDFGVAHVPAFGDAHPEHAVGKLGYLAPETLTGDTLDRRADLFSVGVILYETLTSARLFDAEQDEEDEAQLAQAAEARVPRLTNHLPDIDRELEAVVLRALARRPKDRCDDAETLAIQLEPHWSKKVGNPFALKALVAAALPTEAQAWAARRSQPALVASWPTG